MALVDYSDSEAEDGDENNDKAQGCTESQAAKKRRLSNAPSSLPPLPQSFRDLYSSTVRTSTQDDPSLHGGRKRVTPHVPGNWPTHVYLEWSPSPEESEILAQLIGPQDKSGVIGQGADNDVRSLLQNELEVALPLHVSLSRPLVLKTEQKDEFLPTLMKAVSSCGVRSFTTRLEQLQWHPNEDRTRWFLVLRVTDEDDELTKLLRACNSVAETYGQPRLYHGDGHSHSKHKQGVQMNQEQDLQAAKKKFHISIAWSLQRPSENGVTNAGKNFGDGTDLPCSVRSLRVGFGEVKVRIGQDVTSLSLDRKRRRSSGVLS